MAVCVCEAGVPHGLSAESGRQLLQRGDQAGAQEAAGGGGGEGVTAKGS